MNATDISRVQSYLRRILDNDRIVIDPPQKRGAPVEVRVGEEFLGVVHRDDDDGEISFSLVVSILEEDLVVAPEPPQQPTRSSAPDGRSPRLTTTSAISDGPGTRSPISPATTPRNRSK
jgi:hypothetical protein